MYISSWVLRYVALRVYNNEILWFTDIMKEYFFRGCNDVVIACQTCFGFYSNYYYYYYGALYRVKLKKRVNFIRFVINKCSLHYLDYFLLIILFEFQT